MKKTSKKKDKYWKQKLTKDQYLVCRLAGTEKPGSGKYDKHFKAGNYLCVACGTPLFSSATKFDSGTGWPAFSDVISGGNVKKKKDVSLGMIRTEILCKKCESHLGHVFKDGPGPTGLRYCINSTALDFKPRK